MMKVFITNDSKRKINCWEYFRCGREPGSIKVDVQGVCPAAAEQHMDGVHGGQNAGRACWIVFGTFSNGDVQGTSARGAYDCTECSFFKKVHVEEGNSLVLNEPFLTKIQCPKCRSL